MTERNALQRWLDHAQCKPQRPSTAGLGAVAARKLIHRHDAALKTWETEMAVLRAAVRAGPVR